MRRWAVRFAVAAALWCAAGVGPLRGDEITRRLQEELRRRNLYFGDVDGRISAQLSAALHRYQERKGFPSTGEADTDTLFSLNILRPGETPPPRPDLAAGTRATNSPPAATATPPPLDARDGGVPWPDVTVLRSDEARPAPSSGDTDPATAVAAASSPTPAPPPASTGMVHRPTPEQVRAYLERYLQAGATNDPDAEMRFYGEHVTYYDEGLVDHSYILRDVIRYDHRWPERHFTLLDPVTISAAPGGNPDKFVVNFRYAFHVKGSRYAVAGKTDNVWTIAGDEPDGWKIVSMKEQRVREK